MFSFERKITTNSWALINGAIINTNEVNLVTQVSENQCAILFKGSDELMHVMCSVEAVWQAIKNAHNDIGEEKSP